MATDQGTSSNSERSPLQVGGAFAGREQALAEVRQVLADAVAGHGRLAMLVGEPGIGKAHTAQELAEYAEGQGVQVLWGRCQESQGSPPYWP